MFSASLEGRTWGHCEIKKGCVQCCQGLLGGLPVEDLCSTTVVLPDREIPSGTQGHQDEINYWKYLKMERFQ